MTTAAKSPPPHRRRPYAPQSRGSRREILHERDSHHPAVVAIAEHHAADVQLRVADAITSFAGSMRFVYIHIVLFVGWMLLFEKSPWPTLTLVVSLEAIFLSTFVMIGQNRQSAFQQIKADHEFTVQEKELDENTVLTREIHRLTVEMHSMQAASQAGLNPGEG
jgi:uncharacterized membrane protein